MKESSDDSVQCCSVDSSSIMVYKASARAGFRTIAKLGVVKLVSCGAA